jgi:hypothetical protein
MRTILWSGCIAVLEKRSVDGRRLEDLRTDELPVPVYWRPPPNGHRLLGKVTRVHLHWASGVVKAELELNLDALPASTQTLWPEIDLDADRKQLAALCLGTKPAWPQLSPVIIVT